MLSTVRRMIGLNELSASAFYEVEDRLRFTKDMWELEQAEFRRMFVCDEMMSGLRQEKLVQEASVFMYHAFTFDTFEMYKKKLGNATFPIPFHSNGFKPNAFRIKGEVWAVRPYHYPKLDKYRENGVSFQRTPVRLVVPYHEKIATTDGAEYRQKHHIVRAMMYIAIPDYWKKLMDNGYLFDKVKVFNQGKPLGPYHHFTEDEYVIKNS